MTLLTDQWTCAINELGYEDFGVKLRDLILESQTPLSITIGGRWGAGKTSMLRAVMASLGGLSDLPKTDTVHPGDLPSSLNPEDEDIKDKLRNVWPIWFNPWQYQHEAQPIIPLLHEIREQIRWHATLKEQVKEITIDSFDTVIRNLGKLTDTMVNLLRGKKVCDLGDSIMNTLDQADKDRTEKTFRNPIDAQRFFSEFEKAVSQVTGKDGRLVIFIDDLDRCSDLLVFKLLEQIKLFLSTRHCIFVFGLDRTHVENAIARAANYNMDEARQYVDKLFQARFQIPLPRPDALKEFIKKQLKALELPDHYADKFSQFVPDNPRMIKNILNGLPLYLSFLPKSKRRTRKALLVYLFRTFYPDGYELLLHDPENTLLHILTCFSGNAIDLHDGLSNYLHFITENPTKFSPEKETDDTPGKLMDEARFHKVRAGAWQAEALNNFQEAFSEAFPSIDKLKGYLV